jgi:hypothetical protein
MLEFFLHSINDTGQLIGWCGDRDIPVGAVFTAVRRHQIQKDAAGAQIDNTEVVGAVHLTLREVHWYQRSIDAVPRGHSAALVVAGEGK